MNNQTEHIRRRSAVGTGTTSLLMIFTVLCFATLAMLSLATTASDRKMQENSFKAVEDRLKVEETVAAELASLDAELLALQHIQDEADYYAQVMNAVRALSWEIEDALGIVSLESKIDEDEILYTKVHVLAPGSAARFEIVEQTTRWTGEWSPEGDTELWQGLPE